MSSKGRSKGIFEGVFGSVFGNISNIVKYLLMFVLALIFMLTFVFGWFNKFLMPLIAVGVIIGFMLLTKIHERMQPLHAFAILLGTFVLVYFIQGVPVTSWTIFPLSLFGEGYGANQLILILVVVGGVIALFLTLPKQKKRKRK